MPHRPPRTSLDVRRIVAAGVGILAVAAAVTACTSAAGQPSTPASGSGTTATGSGSGSGQGTSGTTSASGSTAAAKPKPGPFTLLGITPKAGAVAVPTDSAVLVKFSSAVDRSADTPSIHPAVAGTWSTVGGSSLKFTPSVPWPASTRITVSVKAGKTGLVSAAKQTLRKGATASFTTKGVSTLRIEQLLAELHYLPVSFTASGPAHTGRFIAIAESGTFTWRWASARHILGSSWSTGKANTVLHSALMDFQRQHGIASDGVAGPLTTAALIKAALAHRVDPDTYNYVLVSKGSPETLTLYVGGHVKFSHILVNTGVPGANTGDGTFAVYEHVYFTEMRGTDVDGTKYDDDIYWASYFMGGEALHAYPRASYGFPQSNGCVEMTTANAKAIYPYTPVGTSVVVTG